jgi:hypothetical protein
MKDKEHIRFLPKTDGGDTDLPLGGLCNRTCGPAGDATVQPNQRTDHMKRWCKRTLEPMLVARPSRVTLYSLMRARRGLIRSHSARHRCLVDAAVIPIFIRLTGQSDMGRRAQRRKFICKSGGRSRVTVISPWDEGSFITC